MVVSLSELDTDWLGWLHM